MSKRIDIIDEEMQSQDIYDQEIEDTDFGLIISKNGVLKSLFLPEDNTEVPENIRSILSLLGVKDIVDVFENHTIH
ncbi:MAG: hypothetical protein N2235_01435 [Fischerella sp.]|nr:hypothetical protein [Fischerella sp.]